MARIKVAAAGSVREALSASWRAENAAGTAAGRGNFSGEGGGASG
jgi:hypothetical protein